MGIDPVSLIFVSGLSKYCSFKMVLSELKSKSLDFKTDGRDWRDGLGGKGAWLESLAT